MLTSRQNPKIKALLRLKERKERDATLSFLIEGYRELKRAVDGGVQIEQLLFCPSLFLGENEGALMAQIRQSGAEIYECPPHLLEALSYRDRPDGLIAMAKQMRATLADLQLMENPFVVVAESIEKPGNLGSILRSADAAGADAVIVCDRCTDIYNPNVVRSSVGTLFTLPVVEASGEETFAFLQCHKMQICAATPAAKQNFTKADFRGPLALVVGTEQLGLSPFWMEKADIQVAIPMKGVADSLNVAAATTLLLYEVLRQRNL
jgi:TrmH family RNA methyltransferase